MDGKTKTVKTKTDKPFSFEYAGVASSGIRKRIDASVDATRDIKDLTDDDREELRQIARIDNMNERRRAIAKWAAFAPRRNRALVSTLNAAGPLQVDLRSNLVRNKQVLFFDNGMVDPNSPAVLSGYLRLDKNGMIDEQCQAVMKQDILVVTR